MFTHEVRTCEVDHGNAKSDVEKLHTKQTRWRLETGTLCAASQQASNLCIHLMVISGANATKRNAATTLCMVVAPHVCNPRVWRLTPIGDGGLILSSLYICECECVCASCGKSYLSYQIRRRRRSFKVYITLLMKGFVECVGARNLRANHIIWRVFNGFRKLSLWLIWNCKIRKYPQPDWLWFLSSDTG